MIVLFFLSFPFFYIWGIISFVHWIIQQSKQTSSVSKTIPINSAVVSAPSPAVPAISESKPDKEVSASLVSADINLSWQNWYSKNSINFLLYVGAFLIVASASIFVAFQWESISGLFKALLLSVITLAFFGFGLWFYGLEKIRSAGVVFSAIGSLLLPLSGLAWYNFVFILQGVDYGTVWLVTSIICLLIYVVFSYHFRNMFYSYISSLATLSLILSLVNVNSLNKDFYVLGSILAAFIFLVGRIILSQVKVKDKETYVVPLNISANVLLPVSLIYGFFAATTEGTLFSFSSSLALLLGAIFYYLLYSLEQPGFALALAEILFPLAISVFFAWQKMSHDSLLYTLGFIGLCDVGISQVLRRSKLKEGSEISLFMAIIISIGIFLMSMGFRLDPLQQTLFAIFPGILGLLVYALNKDVRYTALFSLFLSVSSFIFVNNFLAFGNQAYVLSLVYLGIGGFYYLLSIQEKAVKSHLEVFGASSVLFFGLSFLFSLSFPGYHLFVTLILAAVLFWTARIFAKLDLIYGSNVLLYVALIDALRQWSIDLASFPIILGIFSVGLYFISRTLPEQLGQRYRMSGILAVTSITIVFGLLSQGFGHIMERNALVTAYLTTVVLVSDASFSKESKFKYLASAAGIITYLWQMKFLGVTESQIYFIPLGVYFICLGYARKLVKDIEGSNLLDIVGLITLFGSALLSAFASDGAKYALLLGIEGLGFILVGISVDSKNYRYAGVLAIALAIFSQTYNYIFSLPRWLITGVAGLVFLTVAIYLLLKRKEDTQAK